MSVNPPCKEYELTVSEQLRQPVDKLLKTRDENIKQIQSQTGRLKAVYNVAETRRIENIELNREIGRVGKLGFEPDMDMLEIC